MYAKVHATFFSLPFSPQQYEVAYFIDSYPLQDHTAKLVLRYSPQIVSRTFRMVVICMLSNIEMLRINTSLKEPSIHNLSSK